MLRIALARGISVAASRVGTIHSLDTPLAELLRLMEQAAAAFQADRGGADTEDARWRGRG